MQSVSSRIWTQVGESNSYAMSASIHISICKYWCKHVYENFNHLPFIAKLDRCWFIIELYFIIQMTKQRFDLNMAIVLVVLWFLFFSEISPSLGGNILSPDWLGFRQQHCSLTKGLRRVYKKWLASFRPSAIDQWVDRWRDQPNRQEKKVGGRKWMNE